MSKGFVATSRRKPKKIREAMKKNYTIETVESELEKMYIPREEPIEYIRRVIRNVRPHLSIAPHGAPLWRIWRRIELF